MDKNMTKKKVNLTAKQMKFCELLGRESKYSQVEAYKMAYNTENMNDNSCRRESSRLLANPTIATTIQSIKDEMSTLHKISVLSDKDRVLEKLREWIDPVKGESVPNASIQAAKLLGDTMALYKNVVVQENDSKSSSEIIEELTKKINKINELQSKPDKLH